MVTIQLDIAQTIGIAAILLVVGEFIKKRVNVLARYFIPGPIIGGLVFSVIALVGHQTGLFAFEFYDNMRAFLLLVNTVFTAITKKKIPSKFEGYIHAAGMILLLGFMAFITFKDIWKLVR